MSEFLERLAIEFEADLKRLRERRRELRDEIAAVEEAERRVATALRKLGLPRPPKPPAPTTTAVEPKPTAEPEPTAELESVPSTDGDAPSATEPKIKRPGRRGWQYDRAPIRDWMRERGTFTSRELREEFGLSTGTQQNILVEFRTQGTIEQVDRSTGTYRFAKPNGGGPNHKPRGEIVATTGTSVAPPPVAGTGRKMKISSSKEVMEMVRVARQHGAEITSTSHGFALTRPGYSGRVTVPSSPSKASLDKLRKKFRTTLGVPV